MSLHPDARAFLDSLDAMGTVPIARQTPEEARASMRARLSRIAEPPPAVARVVDLHIPGETGPLPARAYHPRPEETPPILVYFHGGGWVTGSLDTHDRLCRALANASGLVVLSVDYRLAPEHPFPAAVQDSDTAVQWAAEHGATLGGDPGRLAVGGDSAGGNLAAVAALRARDRNGPRLHFQLLIYPITDAACDTPSYVESAEGYLLTRDAMAWYWRHYLGRQPSAGADPYASPLRAADLSGLPPALVITAERDPLRDEGERYAERLRASGVPAAWNRYPGAIHGFVANFVAMRQGREAIALAAAALRETFGLAPTEAGAPA